MEDLIIDCISCDEEFTFTGEEQDWFNQKGFEDPKRCPGCRENRKAQKRFAGSQRYSENYVEHVPNGGSRRFERNYNRRDERHDEPLLLDERPHYKIRCIQCNEETFVPFIPKGPARCQRCHHDFKQRTGRSVGAAPRY